MEKLVIVKQALNQLFEIGNLTLVNTYFDENS